MKSLMSFHFLKVLLMKFRHCKKMIFVHGRFFIEMAILFVLSTNFKARTINMLSGFIISMMMRILNCYLKLIHPRIFIINPPLI